MLLDYVEKYVMTCLNGILFCPPSTTDEEKDLSIQNRYDHVLHLPWNIHTSVLKVCSIHMCRVVFFNYPFLIFLLGFDSWIGWIHNIWIAELMRQNQKSVIWCTQQLQVCSMCFYHKKCVSFSAELWFSEALSFGDLEPSNSKLEQLMVMTWLVIFLSTKYHMVWCTYKKCTTLLAVYMCSVPCGYFNVCYFCWKWCCFLKWIYVELSDGIRYNYAVFLTEIVCEWN
jgi:hypothetical protein